MQINIFEVQQKIQQLESQINAATIELIMLRGELRAYNKIEEQSKAQEQKPNG